MLMGCIPSMHAAEFDAASGYSRERFAVAQDGLLHGRWLTVASAHWGDGHVAWHHPADHPRPAADRRAPELAPQPELGLLPERRARPAAAGRARLAPGRADLGTPARRDGQAPDLAAGPGASTFLVECGLACSTASVP